VALEQKIVERAVAAASDEQIFVAGEFLPSDLEVIHLSDPGGELSTGTRADVDAWGGSHGGIDRLPLVVMAVSPTNLYLLVTVFLDAVGRPNRSAVDRLRTMGDTPLSSWTTCPACMNPLLETVADIKACKVCLRAYTERGIAPARAGKDPSDLVVGTGPYDRFNRRMPSADYPMHVWLMSSEPAYVSALPHMLPDEDFEMLAFASERD
jgi:hypothetical protein